jgi:acyl transferase domain-containing protein/NADPH-dependent curcumin reductase CurA/acyl carrier protein
MSCRFPGAKTPDLFWQNLRDGVESIVSFDKADLLASGVAPDLLEQPNYVPANGFLGDVEGFDAHFFDFSATEAATLDPQHRFFLEQAWEALEHAGYDPDQYGGTIGVYAGAGINTYLLKNLAQSGDESQPVNDFQIFIRNDKDFLPTRVSYLLNLKGPSINVQTACSTSLVAVHLACQSLLNGECDMALAGGVSIRVPQTAGYLHQAGMILSSDGHCRAFDAEADGTVAGSGAGIVVLKHLDQALAEGDTVHGIILGSAINNDGATKVGYTAPSIDGQAAVIAEAQAIANISPDTITYLETHGTGTAMGDPIEISALTQAFEAPLNGNRPRQPWCGIGSVKTNLGHLDTAAGIAGLIKTTLALKHQTLPPSLHFSQPNPAIDFSTSPFYVNAQLQNWPRNGTPRRAGVSSFGIGGTNAHVVLQEAPAPKSSAPSRPWQLLVLSAKTSTALDATTANLGQFFQEQPDVALPDVAYTLSKGRKAFNHRRVVLGRDNQTILQQLQDQTQGQSQAQNFPQLPTQVLPPGSPEPSVAFLFPGQGSQYLHMARGLYDQEPVFRQWLDRCATLLNPHLDRPCLEILFPALGETSPEEENSTASLLNQTAYAQPLLFAVEYALAQLWMHWGVTADALLGHSLGEYVAATLAGVFSLKDALKLVVVRAKLMQTMAPGAMLAVPLSPSEVEPYLADNGADNGADDLVLAVVNRPNLCVISGPIAAIDRLEQQLTAQGLMARRLYTSHAFHSPMMEPMLADYRAHLETLPLNPPQIPILSNLTGTWLESIQATDPNYWVQHLRNTVQFASGVEVLLEAGNYLLLEVGPGRTLSQLARQNPHCHPDQTILTSLPDVQEYVQKTQDDHGVMLTSVGQLWLTGVTIDWNRFYSHEQRQRLPLPTYPFEHQRYWIDPQPGTQSPQTQAIPGSIPGATPNATSEQPTLDNLGKQGNMADWFYLPSWKLAPLPETPKQPEQPTPDTWLLLVDDQSFGSQLAQRLARQGETVITVSPGPQFSHNPSPGLGHQAYTVNLDQPEDFDQLITALAGAKLMPQEIVHLWTLGKPLATPIMATTIPTTIGSDIGSDSTGSTLHQAQHQGCRSLLWLSQALGQQKTGEIQLTIVAQETQVVSGNEEINLAQATLMGPLQVIPQEYSQVKCRLIDLVLPAPGSGQETQLLDRLVPELQSPIEDNRVAYRGVHRWIPSLEPLSLQAPDSPTPRLRPQGVYLITGGLGAMALTLAEDLATTVQARLILVGRSGFPDRATWSTWLQEHGSDDPTSQKIQRLQSLENQGSELLILQADVTDLGQMQQVLSQAQNQWGQIHGVIHTAGILGDGMIQQKTWPEVEAVLGPKVQGTLVLNQLFGPGSPPLDFWVLCSSIASYQPGFGQFAYCGANAFLDAFAYHRTAQGQGFTVSINWDGWQQGGMGQATEVAAQRLGFGPSTQGQQSSEPEATALDHPLFSKAWFDPDQKQTICQSQFATDSLWVLEEHRLATAATLPGTAYLEMVRVASGVAMDRQDNSSANRTLRIEEITFLAPLVVNENTTLEVRTTLQGQPGRPGAYGFSIASCTNPEQDQWQTHAMGQVTWIEMPTPNAGSGASPEASRDASPVAGDLGAVRGRCDRPTPIPQPNQNPESTTLVLGPRWNNLEEIHLGDREGLAQIALAPEFRTDLDQFWLHPALLDSATSFLTVLFQDPAQQATSPYLPFAYKGITLNGPLTPKFYSHIATTVQDTPQPGQTLRFQITLFNEAGDPLLAVEEYTLRKFEPIAPTAPSLSQSEAKAAQGLETYTNFNLGIGSPGSLESLEFQQVSRATLADQEVEVEVSASALNFREVLIAMGLFPDPTETGFKFGMECTGNVSRLGEGVKDLQIGQEVIVLGQACISRYTVAPANFVIAKPPHLSPAEAATIPNAFGTAYYALVKVGRLQPKEKVLIHAAAGGVGMAAVRIAQWLGAEVFATAGSPEKRSFLRSQGIEHVMDSRTLDFADQILDITQGQGVDVVLNSLGGEFIAKGLSCLGAYGRFLELGMRDILNDTPIGLAPFQRNLTFSAIFLDRNQPGFTELCQEVMQHFHDQHFAPLPHQVFPLNQITEAFEFLAQAKHMGKVIISMAPEGYPDPASLGTTKPKRSIVSPSPSRQSQSTAPAFDFRQNWLLPSEGVAAFHRILNTNLPQVLIATSGLLRTQLESNGRTGLLDVLNQAQGSNNSNPGSIHSSIHGRPNLNTAYVAPSTEIESTISQIWREVLGLGTVGIHDNFFELGGDSLLIVQVRDKIQQALNTEYSTADAFEYPTISSLAAYLGGTQASEPERQPARKRASKVQAAITPDQRQLERRKRLRE